MKFKRNVSMTLITVFTFSFLFMTPALLVFSSKIEEGNIFTHFLTIVGCILFCDLIYYSFNLIAMIFTKVQVYVYDPYFKHLHYTVNYLDVREIIFNIGVIGKTGSTPCSITFFNEEYRILASMDNPSLIMMLIVISRCKNSKFKITGYKVFMWIGIVFFIISLLLILFN